ncbi:tryptophan synthase subunit alpha [Alicyclobacillus mengziensis]|uniref:Tryptophan synthase alpha chain n=1 Tax=Alicyclobacillus mengziensis TaxID=2931921 RepID=A0A9X7VV67_9BACL|nr:tryptophan synthase subunit alpha [Alicyclobacillus mengziensis]QSO45716.1 tryptophan synthase subunit alpha [Alicyclobacillus mengziensis]
MSRIEAAFMKRPGKKALIPFLNTGDPDVDTSLELFQTVLRAGADIVEIGAPYSDPLADGPVIQASALRSLQSGFAFPHVFEMTSRLRRDTDAGLVLFSYFNPLLQYGIDRFFRDAESAGADGVIVPDLPFEESTLVRQAADTSGVDLIPLVAPTSSEERVRKICEYARGFVYCVSSLGVTGERAKMSERLQDLVQTAKAYTNAPVAVGFGVSTPEQARHIASFADGVIIGSAYVRRIEESLKATDVQSQRMLAINAVERFTRELSEAIDDANEWIREGVE